MYEFREKVFCFWTVLPLKQQDCSILYCMYMALRKFLGYFDMYCITYLKKNKVGGLIRIYFNFGTYNISKPIIIVVIHCNKYLGIVTLKMK